MPFRSRPGAGRTDSLLPAAVCGALLLCCVIVSGRKPLWYDELYSWSLLTDPSIAHMLRASASGAESGPPLYHLIGQLWRRVFGDGVLALRLFSSVGFCIAAAATWALLRRAHAARGAAIGLLTVFGTSSVIFQQNAQIRFYGAYLATVAIGLLTCESLMSDRRPSRGALVANILATAAMVLCHVFGAFYSGALFVAVLVRDLARGSLRPAVYLSFVAGWLAFVPWIPAAISQADVGKPHSWIPVPGVLDLVTTFDMRLTWLPLVLLAVVLLASAERRDDRLYIAPAADASAEALATRRTSILLIAAALFAVPVGVFVLSRVAISIFLDRYFVPSALGWAIVIAHLVGALSASSAGVHPRRTSRPFTSAGWWALGAALLLFPVYRALTATPMGRPDAALRDLRVDGAPALSLPIAVESGLEYLPLAYYARGTDARYVLPMDWDVALDRRSPLAATVIHKGLVAFEQAGYLASGIESGERFLCATDRFIALDDASFQWFDLRVASDPAYRVRELGRYETIHGPVTIRLVDRDPAAPRRCQGAAVSGRG